MKSLVNARCEGCTCREPSQEGAVIRVAPGAAVVLLLKSGGVEYVVNTLHTDASATRTFLSSLYIAEKHPDLAVAIDQCTGPQTDRIPRDGMLGRLGLTQEVSSGCAALPFDPTSATEVVAYFEPASE